ncbi:TSC22 domain family protein 1 isoform X1 [Chanos chanos]|uniref:TSC22 domain family protein 1 n=1 Tax=Chanos chanos TaxID=29144 RepID=A0A6J2WBE5_CHACN|nr:TSC22 domain family protein 1 isoform X1 [Chanos chanos]
MHHPDSAGDSASPRKMAHPTSFARRGSSTASGSSSALTASGSASLSNNLMPADDYQASMLIQPQAPTLSSSAGPQHPPQSLNIHSQSTLQPQILPSSGAQMKKKSGFQITSVTPAQISVSTNNSITEDTESCDDLDESHTEDLSSSEILDVSLSRATDMGGAERSSSEETLSNLHEAETPGAVSPNQPPIHHALSQVHSHGTIVNGTIHHHHNHHHGLHHHHHFHPTSSGPAHLPSGSGGTQSGIPLGSAVSTTVTSTSGALPNMGQKMPSNIGGILENAAAGTASVAGKPMVAVAPGTTAGILPAATGATINTVNPLSSNVSNVNILSSASVPGLGSISSTGSNVVLSTSVNSVSNNNVNLIQQQSGMLNTGVALTAGASASGVGGSTSGNQAGLTAVAQPSTASTAVPVSHAQPQQAQVPAPVTTSSRFRVVKLDSNSEPFKKGRWTCTEYYDKETPVAPPTVENAQSTRTVESIRQFVPDSVLGPERENVSSLSSSVSTLSHYSESVGSGETGGPSSAQQTFQQPPPHLQDYVAPHGLSQTHMHPKDFVHAHLKTSTAPSLQASTQQPAAPSSIGGLQTSIGHPSLPGPQQQLTYAQAAQSAPAQALPGVAQQHMGYSTAQQPLTPSQVPTTHMNTLSQGSSLPPDFIQTSTSGSAQTLPQSRPIPPVAVASSGQLMAPSQQPVGAVPTALCQPLPQGLLQPQQMSSAQLSQVSPSGVMPQLVQSAGTGPVQQTKGQQLPAQLPAAEQQPQHKPPLSTPGLGAQLPSAIASNLLTLNVPPNSQSDSQSSLVQNGTKDSRAQPTTVSSALHTSLPSLMASQLEDAQRLLFQHQSLLAFPKLAAGESASQTGTSVGPEGSSGDNALNASGSLLKSLPVDGEEDGSSGASVVAIDNKIEQAMDLVKSHLMYAVREEVEVLKEQIKELIERNSQLEQENNLLKNLASPEQLAQFQAQVQSGSPPASTQASQPSATPAQLASQNSGPSA